MSVASDELYDALDPRVRAVLDYRAGAGGVHRRGWLIRRALVAADVAGLTVAFAVAHLIYGDRRADLGALNGNAEIAMFALSLPFWVVAAKLYGLYDKDEERTDHSATDELAGVFHLVTVCTFLLFAASKQTRLFNPEFGKLMLFWLIASPSVTLTRAVARAYCRRQINYLQNTIIVGAGEVGQEIARKLLKHPEYGINLVGFVDNDPLDRVPGLEHVTMLGSQRDLPELVDLLDVERVVVAFSNESHETDLDLIRRLNAMSVQVDVVPRFFEVLSSRVDFHAVEGLPVCSLPPARLPRSSRLMKRALDLVGAFVGVVLLAPVFVLVAIAIKVDSPGPIFFRQVRVGEHGQRFRIWKFRSMVSDAEARKADIVHLNKHLAPGGDPRMFKVDNDPRVTRVGSWLRLTSMDELPQLLNVIAGEMSLVGPRPLIPDEIAYVKDWAGRRLDLKPGITGIWQVLGNSEIPFGEMVRLDYLYVSSWSLGGDLRLIARTIPAALAGHSAD